MSIDQFNDELDRLGGQTAKFKEIGDKVVGVVTDARERQQTDFATKEPKFWPNGDPKMEWVISLDVVGAEDTVRVYAKGQMLKAIRDAVKTSAGRFDVGGTLAVAYANDEDTGKGNPMKVFVAQYQPPANTGIDLLGDTPTQAPAAQPAPTAASLI